MKMAWAIAAVLALGLGIACLAMLRVVERLIALTALLRLERELLTDLARLLVGDDAEDDAHVETGPRLVDDVPEGRIECGIDVVDADGRVIGTLVIPAPAIN
jgi:hypothetical protein